MNKKINNQVTEEFKEIINEYIQEEFLDISQFIKIQKKLQKTCKNIFIEYGEDDIANNINIIIKISIVNKTISVFPNDLYTALIFNNYNVENVDIENINKLEVFKTKDGKILKFNKYNNTLDSIKIH
jgi:hypothetical protein